jgi:hypothetical protein
MLKQADSITTRTSFAKLAAIALAEIERLEYDIRHLLNVASVLREEKKRISEQLDEELFRR